MMLVMWNGKTVHLLHGVAMGILQEPGSGKYFIGLLMGGKKEALRLSQLGGFRKRENELQRIVEKVISKSLHTNEISV